MSEAIRFIVVGALSGIARLVPVARCWENLAQ